MKIRQEKVTIQLAPHSSLLAAHRAFTLVELLVVITIIGILAALITVAAVGALNKARQTEIRADINQIDTAMVDLKNNVGAFPPNCQVDDTSQAASEPAGTPISEAQVISNLKRYLKQAFPRHAESDQLIAGLAGLGANPANLPGGMSAGEALVFWLGGFSSDPKYPISGEGGPSYPIPSAGAANNNQLDPLSNRKWDFPFVVDRLAPRDANNYFAGRFIEFQAPTGGWRRINFWQYVPRKQDQPYLYFDTSRHPALVLNGSEATAPFDPPAATALAGNMALEVHAFKTLNPAWSSANAASTPCITFVNPDKFQILHCGLDDAWGEEADFERMSGHAVGTNNPNDYLLFPSGPFIGEIADTIVSFAPETKIEDAQK